jgi:exosortase A-associated hydrolase 2
LIVNSTPDQVLFLPGAAGALFTRYRAPARSARHSLNILVVPPFAEEMNKSRRMFTLLAEQLSEIGVGTAIVDLFGTGDSEGDFVEARYNTWRDDVITALRWLREKSDVPLALLGLRFGGLLAADVIHRGEFPIERSVLWQPTTNGEQLMTQFLRLRVAAAITGSDSAKVTTTALREQLKSERQLEVGGYMLSAELVAAVDALRLESLSPPTSFRVNWVEVGSEAAVAPGSTKVCEAWRRRGALVDAVAITGSAFWSAVEITTAPAFVAHTASVLSGRMAA